MGDRPWAAGDRLRMLVDRAVPLAEAAEAQGAAEEGHAAGRIVVTVP